MIDLTIHFDTADKAENPTFILATKSGKKIGLLTNVHDVTFKNSCEQAPEMALKVYKNDGDKMTPFWNDISMYKLIYVPEADTYFSIECDISEGDNGVYKSLTLTRLAEAELALIKVYGLQINTEASIILPDYDANFPVVLYRDLTDLSRYNDIWNSDPKYTVPDDPAATVALRTQILRDSSLMHKIFSFAPHYSIGSVAESIRDIQRIFEFDNTSIVDALKQIAEEESIIFDYTCGDTANRVVNAYDALSSCNVCGYRGHFTGVCPECGSSDINEGFGQNTGILVSAETLGNNLQIQRNAEALANCYHVSGGDELMTSAIRMCNPNGGYVWSFSDESKDEMSASLKSALDAYEALYDDYQNTHSFDLTGLPLSSYNAIVNKYRALDTSVTVEPISSITGYSELIEAYYNAIDFGEYLNHSLLPSITNNGTTASEVVAGLTTSTLSPVSVLSTDSLTLAQASNAVVNYARIKADPLYDIRVVSQELLYVSGTDTYTWVGVLSATNYYDKADTANTGSLQIVVNSNIASYAQNSVMQTLLNKSQGNSAIVGMYTMTDEQLTNALKYYSYQMLQNINDCFVKSIEMLTSIGADKEDNNAHQVYLLTAGKLSLIAAELAVRETEVGVVDFKDSTTCMTYLLWDMISDAIATMKLENNLTAGQWVELNAFRREADYSNDNYVSTSFRRKFDYTDSNFVSDSLSNAELIKRAYEFILQAEYKIKENNAYSYNISTNMQNLLVINEFAGLRSQFKVGNWLRVMDTNGKLFKLRLIDYEIDFSNLADLNVNFADVSLNDNKLVQMRKFVDRTQNVVNKFGKSSNQSQSNLVNKGSDLTNDYTYSDAYSQEIVGGSVTTSFNVIEGLIQGKISAQQALSLITQELGKITLTVQNGNKASTMTILYDGVSISTSGNITLGGTVIFQDDLTDGETVISGDNIQTGQIISANYVFRTGQTFTDSGSLFDLINGNIRTPGLFSNGSTGDLYVKGTIYADAGRIGDFDLVQNDNDSYALDHCHSAWKLRSAPVAGQNGKRYYVSLTKNRNLVVSDSKDGGHTASNDVTVQCNIGTKSYPWRYGYFNRVYMDNCLLGVEYFKLTLAQADWNSTTHRQTKEIVGITADKGDDTKIKQFVEIAPSYNVPDSESDNDDVINNVVAFHMANIVCVSKKKNRLGFQYMGTAPSQDIDIYVFAQYAKPKQSLDDPFNAAVVWDPVANVCYISWSDPNDEMFSLWDSTTLVRKSGSAPADASDGTVLTTYTGDANKSQYSGDNPYVDTQVGSMTPGLYYYGIFATSNDNNTSSYIDSINTSDAPVISDLSETSCTFELSAGYYTYVTVTYKVGSAPSDENDGVIASMMTNVTCERASTKVVTLEGLPMGELYFKVFAKMDDTLLESEAKSIAVTGVYEFDHVGQYSQTWDVPCEGRYMIETWGAQGESDGDVDGGYGGYSVVEADLTSGSSLYVFVGGQHDGYNGGGEGD